MNVFCDKTSINPITEKIQEENNFLTIFQRLHYLDTSKNADSFLGHTSNANIVVNILFEPFQGYCLVNRERTSDSI